MADTQRLKMSPCYDRGKGVGPIVKVRKGIVTEPTLALIQLSKVSERSALAGFSEMEIL
jgi:hypothetical protein